MSALGHMCNALAHVSRHLAVLSALPTGSLVSRTRTAVQDAVMHPQSRLVHHCASARLVQTAPVIEQAKKDAVPVGDVSPADSKRLARAGTSAFALLSASRDREE